MTHQRNKKLQRNIGKKRFQDYLKYACINTSYSDFINKIIRAIDSVAPITKVRVKANSKPWFITEIISEIQKRGKLYSRYKKSRLEADIGKSISVISSKDAPQKEELWFREKIISKL